MNKKQYKHLDPHPTNPNLMFHSWRTLTDGSIVAKWMSKEARTYELSQLKKRKRAYYLRNKEAIGRKAQVYHEAHRDACLTRARNYHKNNRENSKYLNVRNTSCRKGIPFNLPREFFFTKPTHCPVLGFKFNWVDKTLHPSHKNKPTLDRVIPAKGYTVGNVVWISGKANRIKSDSNVEDLRKIIAYIEKYTHANG